MKKKNREGKTLKCFFKRGVEGNLEQGNDGDPADNGKNLLINGQSLSPHLISCSAQI